MARQKTWIERIPLILQHLENDPKPLYMRSDIQALFITGRSQAADLMKVIGAETRNGVEATVSRDNLRAYVAGCPEARQLLEDIARRKQMEKRLIQTEEERVQKAVKIPGAHRVEWTKWKDLPQVTFEPGEVRIKHSGLADFLRTLWLISQAAANQPAKLEELCEPERAAQAKRWMEAKMAGEGRPVTAEDVDGLLRLATPEEKERIVFDTPKEVCA